MTVCKFYSQGNCRFGDNCKFEHPGSQRDGNRNTGGGFGGRSNNHNNNTNRYGAFSGDTYRPNQNSGGAFASGRDSKTLPYHLDVADIKADLSGQRPIYPLSCYGPGRDAPRQLIEGLVEISPEELRLRYYTQRAAGSENVAQQEEAGLHAKMQQQVKAIVDDVDGAIRYIEEGANIHPNRLDIVKGASAQANPSSSPFGQAMGSASSSTSAPQGSAFGQPSRPGFGQPAFGQSATPAQNTSAFGQPSNPGQTTSAFGASSALGQKPSPFGQPSAVGGGSAFGKPAFGASGFGQASMPGSGTAFGQPSGIGQQQSPFGQAAAAANKPAFGQASAPGFGQTSTPAFGQSSTPAQGSAFGQASSIGQTQQAGAFGKPAFGQSPFGQAAQAPPSAPPFGQQSQTNNSPFGQQPAQSTQSPFGQTAQSGQQSSPFGQAQQQTTAQPNPFGGAAPAFGAPGLGAQPAQTGTPQTQNPFGQAAQPTTATSQSPFGAPSQAAPAPMQQQPPAVQAAGNIDPRDRYKEGSPEEYEGEAGKLLEDIYRRVGQMGRFNDDEDIPLTPPKCEWIVAFAI
ncbi:hypothetical protein B5807_02972 [Epicoccum nigrum]|uniref:C3H1-type domain-containing protein n=1 Tax=Epicoccum nigrum TaxID=105696 RepID=A0A1Y2M948_EPING|nr:hypothetical protein B5807_02972 [Epicoccum nigrum]